MYTLTCICMIYSFKAVHVYLKRSSKSFITKMLNSTPLTECVFLDFSHKNKKWVYHFVWLKKLSEARFSIILVTEGEILQAIWGLGRKCLVQRPATYKTLSGVSSSCPSVSLTDLEEATVDQGRGNDCKVSETTNHLEKEFTKSICSKPGKYIFFFSKKLIKKPKMS